MEVKEVHDGYARNFLIPKKIATPFNSDGLKIKNEIEVKEKIRMAEIEKYLKELSENPLRFTLKVGESGEVFGSIKSEDMQKELNQRGLKEFKIETKDSIKKIGKNEVEINFGKGVKKKIEILVTQH